MNIFCCISLEVEDVFQHNESIIIIKDILKYPFLLFSWMWKDFTDLSAFKCRITHVTALAGEMFIEVTCVSSKWNFLEPMHN